MTRPTASVRRFYPFSLIFTYTGTKIKHVYPSFTPSLHPSVHHSLTHIETPLAILPSSPLTPDSVETLCELPLKVYEEQRREYLASLGRVTYGKGFESNVIKDEAWMDVDGEPLE